MSNLQYLIWYLIDEQPQYKGMSIPQSEADQKRLFRALVNLRPPKDISADFLKVQNEYLTEEIQNKGITDITELVPIERGIYLWQGDITTLRCDAIVNAANGGMTGCYCPCHGCIDNAIHTFSGVQLRLECAEMMEKQGYDEPMGKAKITKAYNLPCEYVLHTNLFLWDIKDTDNVRHKKNTGISNEKILKNLHLADQYDVPIVLRCIMLKGINMNKEHISSVKKIFSTLKNGVKIDWLPCHSLGNSKAEAIGISKAELLQFEPSEKDIMETRHLNW